MTDEEKAREYCRSKYYCVSCLEEFEPIEKCNCRGFKCYLDGLKDGRKDCFEQNKDGTLRACNVMKDNTTLRCKKENLERENEQLKERIKDFIVFKENMVREYESKIEKMKNCSNCKHLGICFDNDTIQSCIYQEECEHHEKWELYDD